MVGVDVVTRPIITLRSGALFDFLDPESSQFSIEDVAHGLSNICRYAGQCRAFYSIAEHSIHVSRVATGHELEGLMHDAAEAFMGDVPGPLKKLLPDYKRIEAALQRVIWARFGLPSRPAPEVKVAEMRVLAAEQAQIMPPGTDSWARVEGIRPASIVVEHMEPNDAKRAFLERFQLFRPGSSKLA